MKLTGLAWEGFALPFRKPYATAQGTATLRYGLLLFVHSAEGLVGVGEASPVGSGSRRAVEEVAAALARLSFRLLGTELSAEEAVDPLLAEAEPPVLRFGLETALLDLQAQARGCSVAELLGGTSRALPVNSLIAAESPQEAAAEAKEAIAWGFSSLKLKVGHGSLTQDEELVAAVREAAGPGAKLRVDANQAWSVPQAIEAIRRLARYDLEYVEQPVAAPDTLGLREVRRAVSVPIAADEAVGSEEELRELLAAEAVDALVLKAGRLGGLHNSLRVMRAAVAAGKAVVVTSSLESGVGIAASSHLAATLASHPFAHGLATGLLLGDELLAAPLALRRGVLAVPSGPGLGVSVDERALKRYAIGVNGTVSQTR